MKIKKLTEIQWYRVLIGVLLLIILIMALKMNPKVNIDIDNGNLLSLFGDDCFSKDDLSFVCEWTNSGVFIPVIKENQKYWSCIAENKILYEVKAC